MKEGNNVIWPTILEKKRKKAKPQVQDLQKACGKPNKLVSWASITKGFTKSDEAKDFGNGSLLCRSRDEWLPDQVRSSESDQHPFESSFREHVNQKQPSRKRAFSTRHTSPEEVTEPALVLKNRLVNVTRRESWRRASSSYIRSCPRSLWWGFCKNDTEDETSSLSKNPGSNWSSYWKFRGRNRRVWRRHSVEEASEPEIQKSLSRIVKNRKLLANLKFQKVEEGL